MFKKIILILLLICITNSFADPPNPYKRIRIIITEIHALNFTNLSGPFHAKCFYKKELYRTHSSGITYGPHFEGPSQVLTFDEYTLNLTTTYKQDRVNYDEQFNNIIYSTLSYNTWKPLKSNFYADGDYDVLEANLVSPIIEINDGYHLGEPASTIQCEYEVYLMRKPDTGYNLDVHEIEISETMANSILNDNIYTTFPKIFQEEYTYLVEISTPQLDFSAEDEGSVTISAPIKFQYETNEITANFSIEVVPTMMSSPWLKCIFGQTYFYGIILRSLIIEIEDIIISDPSIQVPQNVLNDLKLELRNLDVPIPIYPAVMFADDLNFDDLNTRFNFEYEIIPPTFTNNYMKFTITGWYDLEDI